MVGAPTQPIRCAWSWAGGSAASPRGSAPPRRTWLEAEVVTADGATRIANPARNRELFWALTRWRSPRPTSPRPIPASAATSRMSPGDAGAVAAMAPLKALAERPACYLSETDSLQDDWQASFWGDHSPGRTRVKDRDDPGGLFSVPHGVGTQP
jgi:hypothetical protein